MVSASTPESVDAIAQIAYALAGSEAAFRAAPFLSLNINHVVPPMRFDPTAAQVLMRAAECGIPAMVNTFGQLGASSPVTIAGCIAQTTAETLAGLVLVALVAPDAAAIFGPRPTLPPPPKEIYFSIVFFDWITNSNNPSRFCKCLILF